MLKLALNLNDITFLLIISNKSVYDIFYKFHIYYTFHTFLRLHFKQVHYKVCICFFFNLMDHCLIFKNKCFLLFLNVL